MRELCDRPVFHGTEAFLAIQALFQDPQTEENLLGREPDLSKADSGAKERKDADKSREQGMKPCCLSLWENDTSQSSRAMKLGKHL